METWPSLFPPPAQDFGGSNDPGSLRTQMTTGRIRQRKRFSQELRTYPVSWQMSDFEFGMFQSWHKYKINGGNDWFYIPLPTGGDGLKTVAVRFVEGKYNEKYIPHLHWQVSANLECEDALVWSEEDFDALLEIGDIGALEAAVQHAGQFINY